MFGSMIASRTALHENIIVAYSRLLTVIRSEMLQVSAHYGVRPLCAAPELELWTACPASFKAGISRDYTVTVCGHHMPDWDLPSEGCD